MEIGGLTIDAEDFLLLIKAIATRHKFCMRPLLQHCTLLHHQNYICMFNRCQTVGNEKTVRSRNAVPDSNTPVARCDSPKRWWLHLTPAVWILKNCTGDRNALPLSTREGGTPLTHSGVVSRS